ncbi:MAG: type IX secretion system membrane protein PorP/SprF [Cytophagaceae bacterium]|jgi:type IX secretion system PorP/SprF family membrane protein|nr:type IX secretion system membrane protein PorP/SprF [Cytophagaceae bacterium]
MKQLLWFSMTLWCSICWAQQEFNVHHFVQSYSWRNPAATGSKGKFFAQGLYRNQWTGMEGAPVLQGLNLQSSFAKNKVGLGLLYWKDNIGPFQQQFVAMDIAYKLFFNEKAFLSFGSRVGMQQSLLKLSSLQVWDANDPMFQQNASTGTKAFFGTGVYFSNKAFRLGISVPMLREVYSTNTYSIQPHFYGMAQLKKPVGVDWQSSSAVQVKLTSYTPVQICIQQMMIYKQKVAAGILWRSNDALGFSLGMTLGTKLLLSYAYDWSWAHTSTLSNIGSHEITLVCILPSIKHTRTDFW